ncbi:hypothetical protein [Xylocopilactobacillus apis]|uniref:Holin n=1 Tax=Xylocopilactobacillus apis TaxID=2932183 RepID=A0AAU9DMJ2_9LACO|nr:hypothetical protein [Xylocopilactobacillus apis]BDR56869.1 hypothetical protein KIMC2_14310 [Xylocopilactobacillus apis]
MTGNDIVIAFISAGVAGLASFLVGKLNVSGVKEDAYSKSMPGLLKEVKDLSDERIQLKEEISNLHDQIHKQDQEISDLQKQVNFFRKRT